MRNSIVTAIIGLCVAGGIITCAPGKKEITLEDYYTMENEFLGTDLSKASKEGIAKKYGYTLQQYEELEEKVKKDPALREKLGAIKLKQEKIHPKPTR